MKNRKAKDTLSSEIRERVNRQKAQARQDYEAQMSKIRQEAQAMEHQMVGAVLKYLRNAYGIKQSDIAELLGHKSNSMISQLEKGKLTPPLNAIQDLAQGYGKKKDLTLILTKRLLPETWDLVMAIITILVDESIIFCTNEQDDPAERINDYADRLYKNIVEDLVD